MASLQSNSNGNLFEIKTIQAAAFRTLIEALKEILTEANLEFDHTGLKVISMDETHTVLVYLRLHSDRFNEYYCPQKHVLGINMIYLFKLIKTIGNSDILTLYLPASNPNKLGIRIENADKATTTTYLLKIFDTNVEDIQIPGLNFTSIIGLPSSDFQKICRDMNGLGDGERMEITSSGSELIFKCMGDFAEQETIISENQSNMKVTRNSKTSEIVQGVFLLKHLVLFTKCTNLCPSIEMYLKNDYPLIIRYTVANLGEVKLVLAPLRGNTIVEKTK
jgi:proliferating cell nuclear antigen|uniref:Proliferating cell nuclear antigen PCNA N-terminal domain-containing protein n=1 Tax=viral metagenome TaxID=1070528 RepID=A0A6C0IBM0_9ZZZZ